MPQKLSGKRSWNPSNLIVFYAGVKGTPITSPQK
jgi:hypothetical protein